ncbi:MAG: hypothetical protein GIKADHBN_03718 [Phycisphaerales bacterium]|nr:hypothetical protein [Phycisphaerales bacterium]
MTTNHDRFGDSQGAAPDLVAGLDGLGERGAAPPPAFLAAVRRRRRTIIAGRVTAAALLISATAAMALMLQRQPVRTGAGAPAESIATGSSETLSQWVDRQLEIRAGSEIRPAAGSAPDAEDRRFIRPGVSDTADGLDDWLSSI